MEHARIVAVAWGMLDGTRPRSAGRNARLGPHGEQVTVPILRITTEDGTVGFGGCRATPEQATQLLGMRCSALFQPDGGVAAAWRVFDYPLWDLAGKQAGRAVYALAAACMGAPATLPFSAPCYDTSLYFDDLHLRDDRDAARLMADEARAGYERGHRAFKIKVGRGARHMPMEDGVRRDIAVVEAVRAAVGVDAVLMLDANNGYTLNLAKHVLEATAECSIYWLEEAFHEDDILYGDLRAWLRGRNLATLIADGEGQADPRLLDWARAGLIDVVQYDILDHGFTNWLILGQQLDGWHIRAAPHHYGGHYGNYVAGHLAGAIAGFSFVEWDEATVPGLDTSGYQVVEGRATIPDVAGFGIDLDQERFEHVVAWTGFRARSKRAGSHAGGIQGWARVASDLQGVFRSRRWLMIMEHAATPQSPMKIGVVLPITEDETSGHTPGYAEIRALALHAEAAGFDSVWIIDHLLFRFPNTPTLGVWEGWTLLTALAEATERVELGSLVLCTAFRNPALLAKMAATVDEVSGGRLILGLGAGWHQPEFDAFGLPFDHRVDRFEEALQIIVPLLRTGHVDFNGTYYQAPQCDLRPRGPRRDGPPLLVGAGRPRMLRLTARHADSWNTCWLGQPTALAERRAALAAACGEEGRDPHTLAVTVGVSITYTAPGETTPPTLDPAKTLWGSPEEIAAAFDEYAQLGVAHLTCALDPCTTTSLAWLAEALQHYHERAAT